MYGILYLIGEGVVRGAVGIRNWYVTETRRQEAINSHSEDYIDAFGHVRDLKTGKRWGYYHNPKNGHLCRVDKHMNILEDVYETRWEKERDKYKKAGHTVFPCKDENITKKYKEKIKSKHYLAGELFLSPHVIWQDISTNQLYIGRSISLYYKKKIVKVRTLYDFKSKKHIRYFDDFLKENTIRGKYNNYYYIKEDDLSDILNILNNYPEFSTVSAYAWDDYEVTLDNCFPSSLLPMTTEDWEKRERIIKEEAMANKESKRNQDDWFMHEHQDGTHFKHYMRATHTYVGYDERD